MVDAYIRQHVAQRRSAREIERLLKRELVGTWGTRSIHGIRKRDVIELIGAVVERGSPVAANKLLKVTRSFFGGCVGQAILEVSPCEGIQPPTREVARDRLLSDQELAAVLGAADAVGGPYGGIVTLLALTGQRREEVAQMSWDEICPETQTWTIPGRRAKNGKPHVVHLSGPAWAVLESRLRLGPFGAGPMPHLASALLQHTDPQVTQEHYNRAFSLSAAKGFATLVESLR